VLERSGIERAIWGGASWARRCRCGPPSRARGVAAWCPSAGRPMSRRPPTRLVGGPSAPRRGRIFEEFLDANIRLRMGKDALARLKSRPERYAEVTGRLRRHSVASLLASSNETYARTDWLADCGRISVCGAGDRGLGGPAFPTPEMSRRLAETIPNARLHVVQGGPALSQSQPPRRGPAGDRRVSVGAGCLTETSALTLPSLPRGRGALVTPATSGGRGPG